jgi:hypothetical protein
VVLFFEKVTFLSSKTGRKLKTPVSFDIHEPQIKLKKTFISSGRGSTNPCHQKEIFRKIFRFSKNIMNKKREKF